MIQLKIILENNEDKCNCETLVSVGTLFFCAFNVLESNQLKWLGKSMIWITQEEIFSYLL